jgi:3-hydroxyacyl-CoA dehydrogenase
MGGRIKTVGVLGTGVIGASWATLFLAKGLRVVLCDPAPGSKKRFEEYLNSAWTTLERVGLRDGRRKTNYEFVDNLLSRIEDIDFVQEVWSRCPASKLINNA